MQILLKKMSLVNFKGIRSAEFDFNPTVNTVLGDNATGKTTIMNAFLWCLFGKDIEDRKDFEIKTYDKDGVIIPRIDHSVELVLDVDSKEITLKRVLSEKWQKKMGADDLEFTGNETTYFWNEVPLKQSEYQSKIKDLIDEGLFKLLTNVNYFHSLHWEKRREIIFSLAGEITDSEILAESKLNNDHSQIIGKILSQGKTLAEAKAETANKKKRIKDEIQFIPSRIDEAERSKPNPVDVAEIIFQKTSLEKQLHNKQSDLDQVIKSETDYAVRLNEINKAYNDQLEKVYKLKAEALLLKKNIEAEVRSEFIDITSRIEQLNKDEKDINVQLYKLSERIATGENRMSSIGEKIDAKRKQWFTINSETLPEFDEDSCTCPTCKQNLPEEDIRIKKNEYFTNFNLNKQNKLNQNKAEGLELVRQKEAMQSLLDDLTSDKEKLTTKLATILEEKSKIETVNPETIEAKVNDALADNEQLIELVARQIELEATLNNKPEKDDTSNDLLIKRQGLQIEINDINKQINELSAKLGIKGQVELIDARIEELKNQESTLAAELNRLEGIEFAILQFEKQRVAFIENKINDKFEYVTFRLFETQINGQEIPVCKTLINGIPYESANTASRINAGLAIINALSDYNSVYAPIFVDNAESTNVFITTKSQVVKLVVTKDKELIFLNLK